MVHVIETLWKIQALDCNTVIKARYSARDHQGMMFVRQAEFYPQGLDHDVQGVKLRLHSCHEDFEISAYPQDILSMDGMVPERFVSVFNLNWDGSNCYTGKKRGRKRKSLSA